MTSMQSADAGFITGRRIDVGGIDVTARRPALHERAEHLGATIDRLDESIKALMGKLEPVLLPSAPHPGETASNPHGEESWLADYLRAMTEKVEELGTVVQVLTARVDL